jgi:hypothetical protein
MENSKKVLIFAGNHRQATDFIDYHRFLNRLIASYCCHEEKLRGMGSEENPIHYVLTGEFWLNPAYRSNYLSSMQETRRAIELKDDKEICKYLEVEWTPPDLGIIIDEAIDSQDKIV